ncbi:glutathione peroxidase, partial [Enterococcus faecalis]|nr:glutathione peroxidase [Enterococcus faecalis]
MRDVVMLASNRFCVEDPAMTTFYQLTATRLDGQPVAMLDF